MSKCTNTLCKCYVDELLVNEGVVWCSRLCGLCGDTSRLCMKGGQGVFMCTPNVQMH